MDIIPHILTEEMVRDMQDEYLALLVACTTERLMKFIYRYIDAEAEDREVQKRIKDAYDYSIQRDKFLESEKTKRYSELLLGTDYSMLSVAMSDGQIHELLDAIDYITTSPYAVPYISSVSSSCCNNLKAALREYTQDDQHRQSAAFLAGLKKYGSLFKDGSTEYSRGTVVKKIVRNLQTYDIMRRGLHFILDNKKYGRTFETWRFL